MSQRFFAGGVLTIAAFASVETAARVEIEAVARDFGRRFAAQNSENDPTSNDGSAVLVPGSNEVVSAIARALYCH
jgi:hypothetical protein